MKRLIGQLAIIVVFLLGMGLSCVYFSSGTLTIAVPLLIWTICLIALGFWTTKKPRVAFITTFFFYIISIVIKYILNDGEYLILYLVHFYFIISIIIGIYGSRRQNN